jgi:galactan 5-O-arabinofuranosyltransferase
VVRLSPGRTVAELVIGGVAAVSVSLGLQWAIGRLALPFESFVPQALAALSAAVILVAVFALLSARRGRRLPLWLKLTGVWASIAGLGTVVVAFPLQGTRYYFAGASVDNPFRLQYMVRMASSTSLADMNYHGMPPYYPAGWFWLGGRFANIFHLPGWAAYKPYSICWIVVSGTVAFLLWSLVVRRRMALLLALVTVLAGFASQGIEEPYAWPGWAWLPPVMLLAWKVLAWPGRSRWWPLGVIGVYLGFGADSYTLSFFFGTLVVLVLAGCAAVVGVRGGDPVGPVVRRLLARLCGIAVVAAPLALVTWAPFLLAGGMGRPNYAAHHLPDNGWSFPTPFFDASVLGLVCLAGLGWLTVRARRDAHAFPLLVVMATVYVWFGLSTLALALHTTLLAFRLVVPLDVVLMVAGAFACAELLRLVSRRFSGPERLSSAGFVAAVVASIALVQLSLAFVLKDGIDSAQRDAYPSGINAQGQDRTDQDAAWTDRITVTINRLTGLPPADDIVLSANGWLLSYQPYWGFQHTSAQYANPLAEYEERNAEIRSWATSGSADQLLARLDANPYEPPNVFVLRDNGSTFGLGVVTDSFPRLPDAHVDDVEFKTGVFESPRFVKEKVGQFVVIVRRVANP